MIKTALAAVVLTIFAAPAWAEARKWHHVSAPMGQYEGGYYSGRGEDSLFSYGCAGFYSTVTILSERPYSGRAWFEVDGKVSWTGSLRPDQYGDTGVTFTANSDADRLTVAQVNLIIDDLAAGKEAKLFAENGSVLSTMSLRGSSDLRNCRYEF